MKKTQITYQIEKIKKNIRNEISKRISNSKKLFEEETNRKTNEELTSLPESFKQIKKELWYTQGLLTETLKKLIILEYKLSENNKKEE